ncbi:MAG TPA: NAD-dependent epimerase/dehydratase family protein [Candidatus Angelobacter sp.]|nr:NAD-dependent epimerase/dehydratase family protein [Candidatus Angelobacter sp.]
MAKKPTVLVTGVSGNLGLRLLEQLPDFHVIGVARHLPATLANLAAFETVDLAEEQSCDQMVSLMRSYRPEAVVHLAFVARPAEPGPAERKRMWLVNVAGSGRVAEAIADYNRNSGTIEKFVHLSSAALHRSVAQKPVAEDAPLESQRLPWLMDKRESDLAIQFRTRTLRQCKTYLLRPQTYAGPTARNDLMSALRGTPEGTGRMAERYRRKGTRVPMLLPRGPQYLERRHQVVHINDMARLVAHVLRRKLSDARLNIMNIAGRGDPLTLQHCTEIAGTHVKRFPGKTLSQQAQHLLWGMGLSSIPPEALGSLLDATISDTSRLRVFLGDNYRDVIQYTCEKALQDSFVQERSIQTADRMIV